MNVTGNVFIDGRFVNNGLVNGPTGTDDVITFTDDVSGAGSYAGNIFITQGFSPGNSPGGVSFDGDVTFENTSQLHIELGGTVAGDQYDQLIVTGNLAAAGTLDVQLIHGFAPQVGDSFELLGFHSRTGQFAHVSLPQLKSGLSWDDRSLLTTGTLSVIPEPGSDACVIVLDLITLRRWPNV